MAATATKNGGMGIDVSVARLEQSLKKDLRYRHNLGYTGSIACLSWAHRLAIPRRQAGEQESSAGSHFGLANQRFGLSLGDSTVLNFFSLPLCRPHCDSESDWRHKLAVSTR